MSRPYEFEAIERKWQSRWLDSRSFEVTESDPRPKYYCLEMLPYPSGHIHMGHVRNYSIGDAVARFKRMRGFNVLHPIGWDALGLPAENAALKHGAHPEDWTRSNIAHMKTQLQRLGFSYAWEREIATCDPEYYRWNQWFFIQMWKKGLAYRKKAAVNWCPTDRTVLANEQVIDRRCWRCDTEVVQKDLEQWFLRITSYADELLDGLDNLPGWPGTVLTLQRNWIGRSEGAEVDFRLAEGEGNIRVFTTRIDTIYGATFVVLAPEHPLSARFAETSPDLRAYIEKSKAEERVKRLAEEPDKTGVATGRFAVNPFTGERVPIWIASYVLMEYGTGAVMAVPAHDERDFAFARAHGLDVRAVIQPPYALLESEEMEQMDRAYPDEGTVVDSGPFTGLPSKEALRAMTEYAEEQGFGKRAITYKLRDWGISRQRYWGTPIPMVHCDACGVVPVREQDLPVVLPRDVTITGKGESVLRENEAFIKTTCPGCSGPARRETDTMDTFVDSSWYFYRYTDPHCSEMPFRPEIAREWFPIDIYIGGVEHAILHLIYSRFWTRVMRDLGLVDAGEPVESQLSQGMVIKDGSAMSKSKGNIVEPEEVAGKYGVDALRLYVLFEAPPEKEIDWTDARLEGPSRFVQRVWRFVQNDLDAISSASPIEGQEEWNEAETALRRKTHQTILKVTRDIEDRFHLNTAIAATMELTNELYKSIDPRPTRSASWKAIREATETLLLLLSPFAPHLTEELWEALGHDRPIMSIEPRSWPAHDPAIAAEDRLTLVVQVNGKLRGRLSIGADEDDETIKRRALEDETVKRFLEGKEIVRVVVVPKRLVNVVVSG